jgi:hypothetical protein
MIADGRCLPQHFVTDPAVAAPTHERGTSTWRKGLDQAGILRFLVQEKIARGIVAYLQ